MEENIYSTLLFSEHTKFILQLITALFLGMLLGAERKAAHSTAGLRTFGLVSMGACLFVIIGLNAETLFANFARAIDPALLRVDIFRILAGIITGIGFLGAGVIIFKDHGQTVVGLTTAAGLWVASGIGIAVGFELYAIAVATTILTFLTFSFFQWLEDRVFE